MYYITALDETLKRKYAIPLENDATHAIILRDQFDEEHCVMTDTKEECESYLAFSQLSSDEERENFLPSPLKLDGPMINIPLKEEDREDPERWDGQS